VAALSTAVVVAAAVGLNAATAGGATKDARPVAQAPAAAFPAPAVAALPALGPYSKVLVVME
jgi:hypothetical protein